MTTPIAERAAGQALNSSNCTGVSRARTPEEASVVSPRGHPHFGAVFIVEGDDAAQPCDYTRHRGLGGDQFPPLNSRLLVNPACVLTTLQGGRP